MCAPFLGAPYIYYEQQILNTIKPGQQVLELGAGTGLHTKVLLETGANIVVTDIADHALALIRTRFGDVYHNFTTELADMEHLRFADACFDAVVCAGSLSYGDPNLVFPEIARVLRPGGHFVFVDSFNHNPIYKLNHWINYLRGKQSKSVIRRIPDANRLTELRNCYSSVDVRYFGGFSFAMPLCRPLIGEQQTAALSAQLDRLIRVRKWAFKIVVVARK